MSIPLNSKGNPVSVDPKCWDLAELFLAEFKGRGTTDAHIADLAEEIQRCCESGSDEAGVRALSPICLDCGADTSFQDHADTCVVRIANARKREAS